ncbi:hypothetical protein Dimus_015945 [Dionaea muscipula]
MSSGLSQNVPHQYWSPTRRDQRRQASSCKASTGWSTTSKPFGQDKPKKQPEDEPVEVEMRPDLVVLSEDWVSMVDIRPDLSSSSEVSASAMWSTDWLSPGSSTMPSKPIEEFLVADGLFARRIRRARLRSWVVRMIVGLDSSRSRPRARWSRVASTLPPVSSSSSLSTSSRFSSAFEGRVEGDDGSAMAADR